MVSETRTKIPSYRRHKASGNAVVTLNGRDHYLGPHGTPDSKAEYRRLIAEWLANGRRPGEQRARTTGLTVGDVVLRYWEEQESSLSARDAATLKKLEKLRYALRPLAELYGHTPAATFGPKALQVIQRHLAREGKSASLINQRVWIIRRVFRWAVTQELVPPAVHHGLEAVSNVRPGELGLPAGRKVVPVSESDMRAILPFVSRQVAAMVLLQWWTGARPGEIVAMRPADLDHDGLVWIYRPQHHKTEHLGRAREIALGPSAQAILHPFLDRVPPRDPEQPIFSPKEAEQERSLERRAGRRSPLTPSQRARQRLRNRSRAPGDAYTVGSYRVAIQRAVAAANGAALRQAIEATVLDLLPEPARCCFQAAIDSLPARLGQDTLARRFERAARKLASRKRFPIAVDPEPLLLAAERAVASVRGIPTWHPHQLRHSAATRLRREFGLEAARVVLGHTSPAVTEVYAEIDTTKARKVMEQAG